MFERAQHIADRPRDWTILIHWAMPLFKKLLPEHLIEKLPQALCNPNLKFDEESESLPVFNGETGELLFKNKVPGARRVSRQRLRGLLAHDLDEAGIIRWGKGLAGFRREEGSAAGPVQLQFEDGTTYDADYILGADGSSSKLRQLLFDGDEAAGVQLSGFMFATAIVQYSDAAKVEAVLKTHPVVAITMSTNSVGGCGGKYFPSRHPKSGAQLTALLFSQSCMRAPRTTSASGRRCGSRSGGRALHPFPRG